MIQCAYFENDGVTRCPNHATCMAKSPLLGAEIPACDEHSQDKQRREPNNGEQA